MTGSTPWWGTLLVAGLGLVGVLLTQLLNDRRERRRLVHDDRRWVRANRAATYEEFYRVIAAFRRVADRLGEQAEAHRAARTRFGQIKPVKSVGRMYEELGNLADDAAKMYGRIRLLAPPGVIDAAGSVVEALTPYQEAQVGTSQGDEGPELFRRLDAAVAAMRSDLDTEQRGT
jgi:hypothetical protein